MKKIFAIILSVVMCFGLAACSGGGSTEQASSEPKELKLVDSGYSYIDNYLYYAFIIENPNEDIVVQFPTVRITARNSEGEVLGTTDQTLSDIHSNQRVEHAFLGFELTEAPSNVDFEILPSEDYNLISEESSEYPNMKKMTTTGVTETVDEFGYPSFSGEIVNENDYDFSSVAISVLFRDSEGKLIGGDTTYVDNVSANGNTPFTLDVITYRFEYSSYDIFVNPWV